jgi:pyrroloquinoline quinone biosynthesis protein B
VAETGAHLRCISSIWLSSILWIFGNTLKSGFKDNFQDHSGSKGRIMLRVVVLGAAAGGGVPQWNCGCPVCRAARGEHPELRSTQASLALSADGEHWFLINASPDLRQQLIATPQLHPRAGHLRHTPIAGVILTNGEVDAVAGLLSMREGSPFTVYAHAKVLAILMANSIFNVLGEINVRRQPIEPDRPFEPTLPDGSASGIEILPFTVPGKGAWYLEGKAHPGGSDGQGDTLGLRIEDKTLAARLAGAPLVFFDGTVWRDDELITAGLGSKTGRAMGHIAMSGPSGAIEKLAGLDIDRKIFLHINNSNPALLPNAAERHIAEHAGWQLPADGTEIVL